MTATSIARPFPARWTRVYWPAALTAAVLGYLAADLFWAHWRGEVLAAGAVVILVPEITMLALGRDQDTFSDWTWGVLDVARRQPLQAWSAVHFLALMLYLVIAVRVLWYLWDHSGYWLAAAATGTGVWLLRHLFWGLWR